MSDIDFVGDIPAVVGDIPAVVGDIPTVVNQAPFSLEEARVCTGPDDKTLLDLVGRASPYPAVEFLKEVHSFSQAALDMALILACQQGFLYLIQKLVQLGADIECRDSNGKTPLMLAAGLKGREVILQTLLHHGADCSDQDDNGDTALLHAIMWRCPENSKFLIQIMKNNTSLLNLQNSDGYTALMSDVHYDDCTVVSELIDSGADVNITDTDGNTALHLAVQCRSQNHTQVLINSGCDINLQNNDGLSPLMLAAERCDYLLVSTLINLGADLNAVSCKDASKTALSYVPMLNNREYSREMVSCIEALLDKGAYDSFPCPRVLPTVIANSCQDIIPIFHRLINCGLLPIDIDIDDIPLLVRQHVNLSSMSPMCLALLVENVSLARYFWRIMFMTVSDLYLSSNKILRRFLQSKKTKKCEECLSFLEEVSPQPLLKMCFVAVSSDIGASQGREARVNKLPLPWVVKDMLLFKSDVESLTKPFYATN